MVGAATGYTTALAAGIASDVTALESDAKLAEAARANLSALGFDGVKVVDGPLEQGVKRGEGYTLIIVDGAISVEPTALLEELADGGRLVAIARAIISDPTLLVCDEPTGDLDRQSAEEVLNLLEVLNREHGKTIIMVTHDPKAAQHATHTLHLEKGTLVESAA